MITKYRSGSMKLSHRERTARAAYAQARALQQTEEKVPYRRLRGHPIVGEKHGKSFYYWLYGEAPESTTDVGIFFVNLDVAIAKMEEDGLFPYVGNVTWWNLDGDGDDFLEAKVLQVYIVHSPQQGQDRPGTFFFLGAFFPKEHSRVYGSAIMLSEVFAKDWGLHPRGENTLTSVDSLERLNLYEWKMETKGKYTHD